MTTSSSSQQLENHPLTSSSMTMSLQDVGSGLRGKSRCYGRHGVAAGGTTVESNKNNNSTQHDKENKHNLSALKRTKSSPPRQQSGVLAEQQNHQQPPLDRRLGSLESYHCPSSQTTTSSFSVTTEFPAKAA